MLSSYLFENRVNWTPNGWDMVQKWNLRSKRVYLQLNGLGTVVVGYGSCIKAGRVFDSELDLNFESNGWGQNINSYRIQTSAEFWVDLRCDDHVLAMSSEVGGCEQRWGRGRVRESDRDSSTGVATRARRRVGDDGGVEGVMGLSST